VGRQHDRPCPRQNGACGQLQPPLSLNRHRIADRSATVVNLPCRRAREVDHHLRARAKRRTGELQPGKRHGPFSSADDASSSLTRCRGMPGPPVVVDGGVNSPGRAPEIACSGPTAGIVEAGADRNGPPGPDPRPPGAAGSWRRCSSRRGPAVIVAAWAPGGPPPPPQPPHRSGARKGSFTNVMEQPHRMEPATTQASQHIRQATESLGALPLGFVPIRRGNRALSIGRGGRAGHLSRNVSGWLSNVGHPKDGWLHCGVPLRGGRAAVTRTLASQAGRMRKT